VVFSSLNHALADSLDPGLVAHQIGCGSLTADLERIAAAVADPGPWRADPQRLAALLQEASEEALGQRWRRALAVVDDHWQRVLGQAEAPLRSPSPLAIRWRQGSQRLRGRLPRWPLRR
jgi:hypothetical protein